MLEECWVRRGGNIAVAEEKFKVLNSGHYWKEFQLTLPIQLKSKLILIILWEEEGIRIT